VGGRPEAAPSDAWRALFDVDPGYLNTASVGVPPRAAVAAVTEVLEGWRRGRLEPAAFDLYVTRSRAAWARLSGVDPGWVAIGASGSALVGLVAASLPAGACVLLGEGDFTSVLFPFLAQQPRGVRIREVPLPGLVDAVDDTVDLVAVSSVQSADGRVLDVGALTAAAVRHGARVLLDTTQSCGWLPVDCSTVDYAVCAAYKWLLSPRGVAFLSVRPEHLDTLTPHAANWYAGADIWSSIYGSPLRLSAAARRLDTSPAWFSWVGAAHALELLAGLDAEAVRAHDVGLADAFLAGLGRPPQGSAIVTVDAPGAADALAGAGVRSAVRAGRVRASFHLYNDDSDVERALAALRA
jgi:selenocysteine lyase/cysteine desulfurase